MHSEDIESSVHISHMYMYGYIIISYQSSSVVHSMIDISASECSINTDWSLCIIAVSVSNTHNNNNNYIPIHTHTCKHVH